MTNPSKIVRVTRKHKLPRRYPEEQEILIFEDISDLDHVLIMLNHLGEELRECFTPNITLKDWKRLFIESNNSPISSLIVFLRKACIEYERFWRPATWSPESDRAYMACMNDPLKLSPLVRELTRGRLIAVIVSRERKNGSIEKENEETMLAEPAYLACAESLLTAMEFSLIPAGKDWIHHCIKRLSEKLTYYHVAALEVVLRKNEAYLIDNKENIETVRKTRKRSKLQAEIQKEKARKKASEALSLLEKYHKSGKYRNKTEIVIQIAVDLKVKQNAVWRYLKNESTTKEAN